MTFRAGMPGRRNELHKVPATEPIAMQVTQEDGGRLNAFAKEPRMEVVQPGSGAGANRMLLIGGLVLVLGLMAVAAGIS